MFCLFMQNGTETFFFLIQQPKFHFTLLPGNSQLKPTLGLRDFFCFVLRETKEHNFECIAVNSNINSIVPKPYNLNLFNQLISQAESKWKPKSSSLLDT